MTGDRCCRVPHPANNKSHLIIGYAVLFVTNNHGPLLRI